jgi:hypothetical protein
MSKRLFWTWDLTTDEPGLIVEVDVGVSGQPEPKPQVSEEEQVVRELFDHYGAIL